METWQYRTLSMTTAMAIPFCASASAGYLGYSLRRMQPGYRWGIGMGFTALSMSISGAYVAKMLKARLSEYARNPFVSGWRLLATVTLTLWMANAHTGLFGGNKYFAAHGIDSHRKAVLNALCAGQVYFRPKTKSTSPAAGRTSQRYRSCVDLMKVCGVFGAGHVISKLIQQNPSLKTTIESNRFLNAEMLKLLYCFAFYLTNVSSCVYGILFGGESDDDASEYVVEVVKPYKFVYTLGSVREFWKSWSRPVGEFLRYVVYEPLGGRKNMMISVPALFAWNGLSHYQLSRNLYGLDADRDWNKLFSVLCGACLVQIGAENYLIGQYFQKDADSPDDVSQKQKLEQAKEAMNSNRVWQVFCFGLVHVSMSVAVDLAYRKAFGADLSILGNTFLLQPVFVSNSINRE